MAFKSPDSRKETAIVSDELLQAFTFNLSHFCCPFLIESDHLLPSQNAKWCSLGDLGMPLLRRRKVPAQN